MELSSQLKLAQLAGVKVGQSLEIEGKELKVTAITENYVGHFIYMSQASYEQIYGQLPQANTYLVGLRGVLVRLVSKDRQACLWIKLRCLASSRMLQPFDSLTRSQVHSIRPWPSWSLYQFCWLLLSSIIWPISTWLKESVNSSTIKVLGFHNKEVTLYIYRETIILSLVGIVFGLVSGFYLHQFLIQMISPATILFYPPGRLGGLRNPSGSSKHYFDPAWFLCQSSSEKSWYVRSLEICRVKVVVLAAWTYILLVNKILRFKEQGTLCDRGFFYRALVGTIAASKFGSELILSTYST